MTKVLDTVKESGDCIPGKQLNDLSFKKQADESGIASAESDLSSAKNDSSGASPSDDSSGGGIASTGDSWEDFEGEIVNLTTFQLDIMQSSNVARLARPCEISTIEHENGTPQLRKGNIKGSK